MFYVKSTPAMTGTSISDRTARSARSLLICLLTALLLLGQTAEAAAPVSKQLRKFPIGVAIQVQMVDGRVLEGKLVSSSEANFEMRESGQESVETIECGDVKAVNQIGASPRKKRTWVTAAIVVGALAATGFAASRAGGFY
jgi:hypothetical protein